MIVSLRSNRSEFKLWQLPDYEWQKVMNSDKKFESYSASIERIYNTEKSHSYLLELREWIDLQEFEGCSVIWEISKI
jgi:hypothetical protein